MNNTTLIATTQTALLLAEMDEDQTVVNKTCHIDNHLNSTVNELDLNATGFIVPEDNEVKYTSFGKYIGHKMIFNALDTESRSSLGH